MEQKKYDFIASIGYACGCSGFLRRCKLQYASLPFDWNFCSGEESFEQKINIILSDFKDFINMEDLYQRDTSDLEDHDIYCDYYCNSRNKMNFLHDFPIGVPLETSYPTVLEKYQRRIKRFYQRVQKSRKVLFVWFCRNTSLEEDRILKAQKQLSEKFPNQQIDLLIVEDDNSAQTINEEIISPNITRIKYNMSSPKTDKPLSKVMGNLELGEIVFRQFHLNQPWWFKPIQKLIYCLPGKSLRKSLKRKLYNYG